MEERIGSHRRQGERRLATRTDEYNSEDRCIHKSGEDLVVGREDRRSREDLVTGSCRFGEDLIAEREDHRSREDLIAGREDAEKGKVAKNVGERESNGDQRALEGREREGSREWRGRAREGREEDDRGE
ncbi:hypothetical protein ACLOJK_008763 [Asimina triloba]